MIDPSQFNDLVNQVAKLNGLDLETAGDVVAEVGDTLCIDPDSGKVVVNLPSGKTLKVIWPSDEN